MGGTVAAVLFDLDGTLLDHASAARTAFLDASRQWLPALTDGERDRAFDEWRRLEAVHMRAFLDRAMTFQEQRRARVRGLLAAAGAPGEPDDGRADALFAVYLRRYEASWAPFGDVAPAMRLLRGLSGGVAILSNGERRQQVAKVARLCLSPSPRLFVPADVGAAKPSPESFLNVCAAMGWHPPRVLYVGDDPDTDALAAARAGLIGCWLDRPGGGEDRTPPGVHRVSGLADLAGLLGE